MKTQNQELPKLSRRILSGLMNSYTRSSLDDLDEEYSIIAKESGIKAARAWYRRQALKSVPSLLNNALHWNASMFGNYLKIAVRNLLRHKGFSFINILGLAVGMACAVIIILWVQYELSYNRFHNNAENLYRVAFTSENNDFHSPYVVGLLAEFLKSECPGIVDASNAGRIRGVFTTGDKSFSSYGYYVHPSFFGMFSFPFVHGDAASALLNPYSIVMTERAAGRFFGPVNPVGKTLSFNSAREFTVTGVVKDIPDNSTLQFEFLLPFEAAPEYMKAWDIKSLEAFVLLQENIPYQEVSNTISGVYNDHNPGAYSNILYLQPFVDVHLYALGGGGLIIYIYIFSSMALAVLLIACINFMNLSTARTERRYKEVSIRKTLGSKRAQLIRQFLCESILLSIISMVLSVVLVEAALPEFNSLFNKPLDLKYSGSIIAVLSGIAVITGFAAGTYPAFFISSFKPVQAIKGVMHGSGGMRSSFLRKTLVVIQFSFATVFIIAILVIYRQLDYMNEKDLGYNRENLLIVPIQAGAQRESQLIKDELLKHPDIEGATVFRYNFTGWRNSVGISWEGKHAENIFAVGGNWVDYDYVEMLNMKMVEGRFFSQEFPLDRYDSYVVNETLVRAMGIENPVGKRITRMPDTPYERTGTIIGVIKDYHTESLHEKIRPFMLMLNENGNYIGIRIKRNDISETVQFIEDTFEKLFPGYPFSAGFLNDYLEPMYRNERITGGFFIYIAMLSVLVSCLGLFGLAAFSAEQRTKEIGVRKVLGASSPSIIIMLLKDFAKWVLVADLIALPAAWFMLNKWLQKFAYRVDAGLWVFLFAGLLTLLIAVCTVCLQASRAARTDPVKSLKYE